MSDFKQVKSTHGNSSEFRHRGIHLIKNIDYHCKLFNHQNSFWHPSPPSYPQITIWSVNLTARIKLSNASFHNNPCIFKKAKATFNLQELLFSKGQMNMTICCYVDKLTFSNFSFCKSFLFHSNIHNWHLTVASVKYFASSPFKSSGPEFINRDLRQKWFCCRSNEMQPQLFFTWAVIVHLIVHLVWN